MQTKNKAEKNVASHPFNTATPPSGHRGRRTPARLNPLAAVLVLALNGAPMTSLPTLGAVTAGGFLMAVARDARAQCVLAAPFVNYTCTGSSDETLGGRLDGSFGLWPIDTFTINSGSAQANMVITTTSVRAEGIAADLRGAPTSVVFEVIPQGDGGSSAPVLVDSHANITTYGANATGIFAQSQAGGIPSSVVAEYRDILVDGGALVSGFYVTQVDGQASNVGTPVAGKSLVDRGGVLTQVNGGTFTIDSAGSAPVFDRGHDFDDLAIGESRTSIVSYAATNLLAFLNPLLPSSTASLVATVTRTGAGFTTEFGVNFAQYGNSPEFWAQTSLLPYVFGYFSRYLENQAIGGAANTVTVNSAGTIDTFGQGSHGIFAQSKGGTGRDGSDSLGNGDPGRAGQAGGAVHVTNHSDITTRGLGANGIVARSVGGDGGDGGDSDVVGEGGDGGQGGRGGAVTVTNHGTILTTGAYATGIIAQTLGGSSGSSGDGGWINLGNGTAGSSGSGGTILVDNFGNITTTGYKSRGIYAQAVGGFAGDGGDSAGLISFGADGGSGGYGGDVTVNNRGAINTTAEAIFAQSIGGGGGNAGSATGVLLTVGGDGRRGGSGGTIAISNDGQLDTSQDRAIGIFAASIGGGGGTGGDGDSYSTFLGAALGGNGDAAGMGGVININNGATVTTRGNLAHGIYGLSVGGGGGFAGDAQTIVGSFGASAAFSMGGRGGSGGMGNTVNITNSGNILTQGDQSFGIGAQSIGGGGGAGGSATSIAFAIEPPKLPRGMPFVTAAYSMAMGGDGASGGNGGRVNVGQYNDPVTGTIETSGFRSYGLFAQSVGGGGGDGGQSVSGAVTLKGNLRYAYSFGGNGDVGGNGGLVSVFNNSSILTKGALAYGILAQSVGGGGGSGGSSIALTFEPVPQTQVDPNPPDPNALSIPNYSFTLAMGGSGGAGGTGGGIYVNQDGGTIHTEGAFAHGILAQSVGGGGGTGGNSISSNLGLFLNADTMRASTSLGGWSLPGSGAVGQHGGLVTLNINADILTEGNFANGILAQSIGGGGGASGLNFDTSLSSLLEEGIVYGTLFDGFYDAPRGQVRRSGDGRNVQVTSTGDIVTTGAFAHGILAQSVGGGGGISGINISDPSNIRASQVVLSGTSLATTRNAFGMSFAGTSGGGGSGGEVEVIHSGNITATGANSSGIYAQSVGSGGSTRNNITVSIDNGTVQGGSGASAGISIHDGLNNSVTILRNGTVTTLNALSIPSSSSGGYAIAGTGGNETVNNHGAVIGNVNLGTGGNSFNNLATGLFSSGDRVALGAGNQLSNGGTISPGGLGALQLTTVEGNFRQTEQGVYAVDLYGIQTTDRIRVTGSAQLAGTLNVDPGISTPTLVQPGIYALTVITADLGLSGSFTNTILPTDTAVLSYGMDYTGREAQLVVTARSFDAVLAPGTTSVVGGVLSGIDPASMSADLQSVLIELQSLPDAESVGNALKTLGPEAHDSVTRATSIGLDANSSQLSSRLGGLRTSRSGATRSADAFVPVVLAATGDVNSLMDGASKAVAPRHGLWLEPFGKTGTQADEAGGFTGFKLRSNGLTVGYDQALGEHSVVGAAFGYARTRLDFNGQSARGEIGNHALSLYGSWDKDGQYVQGILSYGNVKYEQSRNVIVGGISRVAVSQHRGKTVAADLEAGFMSPSGNWRRGPYAAARFASIREEAFSETGAGGLSLLMAGKNTDTLNAELGFRAERASAAGNGELLVGLTAAWLHDFAIDDRTLSASYDGASGNAFAIPGLPAARNGAKLGASLSYVDRAGWMAALRYQFEVREGFRSHGLAGEMRLSF